MDNQYATAENVDYGAPVTKRERKQAEWRARLDAKREARREERRLRVAILRDYARESRDECRFDPTNRWAPYVDDKYPPALRDSDRDPLDAEENLRYLRDSARRNRR